MTYELWNQFGETVTHVLGFIIFFWIIKKFAWPAIIHLLEDRQRHIEEGFDEIERKQADLAKMQQEYEGKLRNIEQEARVRIQEAVSEGRRVADEINEKAREEAQQITDRAKHNIDLELAKARVELRDEIVGMVLNASERLLRQKVDEKEDRRLVTTFIRDLESNN